MNVLETYRSVTARNFARMGPLQLFDYERRCLVQTNAANCLRLAGKKTNLFVLRGGQWCFSSHIDYWAEDVFNAIELDLESFQLVSRFHHTDKQKFEAACYRQLHRLHRKFQEFLTEKNMGIPEEGGAAHEIMFGAMIALFIDEVLAAKASEDPMKKLISDCDTEVLKLKETLSGVYDDYVW